MSASSEQILQQALALSPQDRAEIVERLLASFQVPPDPHLDELWAREAERPSGGIRPRRAGRSSGRRGICQNRAAAQ